MPIAEHDRASKVLLQQQAQLPAKDFHATFGLGTGDKHIDVVDGLGLGLGLGIGIGIGIGIGVSIAAIQVLQRQIKQKDAQLPAQHARIPALEAPQQTFKAAMDTGMDALEQWGASVAAANVGPSAP